VLSSDMLKSTPVASWSSQSLSAMIPGVVSQSAQDVGGNQGHVGGGLSFRGVNGVDSTIMVDGMNYHTLRGGAGGSTRVDPPNPLRFAEANMGLSAQGVEFQTSGIQMSLVPKDGGNQLSGSTIAAYASSRFQSVNTNADLQARGLTAPPRIDHAYENGVG